MSKVQSTCLTIMQAVLLVALLSAVACDAPPSPQELNTQLFVAARSGDAEGVADLIARGADPNAPGPNGLQPLFMAVIHGHHDAVMALLEGGANPNVEHAHAGGTPLHAGLSNPQIVSTLVEHGARVNAPTALGDTPLHVVGQLGASGIGSARVLIENGADVNAKNNGGRTPLDAALQPQGSDPSPELAEFLVEHGAEAGKGADGQEAQGQQTGGPPGGAARPEASAPRE